MLLLRRDRTAWGEGDAHGEDAVNFNEHDPKLIFSTKL